MIRRIRLCIVSLSMLIIAQRAPAPIVEQAETPAPLPTTGAETGKLAAKPKRKSLEAAARDEPAETKSKEPAKSKGHFEGTWSGKINQEVVGNVEFTLTFAPGGSQVTEHSAFGTYSHAVTSNGQTATWKNGFLNEITWTFTPNSDGHTARVTSKSGLGVNGNATFRRGAPAAVKPPSEFPTAKPVPEKPGFVYNPYDPISRIFIDVRGKPSGSKLVDPKSGKTFIVP